MEDVTHSEINQNLDLDTALSRIISETSYEGRNVSRLEVNLLQSGEVTYRVQLYGEDDYEGGYLPPE